MLETIICKKKIKTLIISKPHTKKNNNVHAYVLKKKKNGRVGFHWFCSENTQSIMIISKKQNEKSCMRTVLIHDVKDPKREVEKYALRV